MASEHLPEDSGPGSVVLDIGDGVGAAVVTGVDHLEGVEIEIRPTGRPWDGRHVSFRRRDVPGGPVVAAVFAQLEEGSWQARLRDGRDLPVLDLPVTAGRVTWSTYPPL